ncbi:hypothetical protein HYPSUDRAFT_66904 [Hypholoma sublateritium FD-334 SS-4]|uniref:DUF3328 domain-containing protein n=1 Tax=Hypholoma sublateritium (strain FD-334 SS-4) TaxID=945553 RepID=A0A0D2PSH4_HYPSF|nr:hypothetical protein HYPSUDRAFT_66904 [Hypholoma sublateritium FD-334 SS-4]
MAYTKFSNYRILWAGAVLSFTAMAVLVFIAVNGNTFLLVNSPINAQVSKHEYTYLHNDYPEKWPIPALDKVHMSLENTVHYAFDTPEGRAEWDIILPSGGAVVRLGPRRRPFTVGMFHQIRCLGIIRDILDDLYRDTNSRAVSADRSIIAGHCMNYLRQMVLCSSDVRLETVRAAKGHGLTVPDVTHVCLDWEAVYREAEKNYQTYMNTPK